MHKLVCSNVSTAVLLPHLYLPPASYLHQLIYQIAYIMSLISDIMKPKYIVEFAMKIPVRLVTMCREAVLFPQFNLNN